MQATLSVVVGILLGYALVGLLGGRIDRANPTGKPSALAWTALGVGAAALLLVTAGLVAPAIAPAGAIPATVVRALPAGYSILLAVTGAFAAVGALAKGDRHWVAWVALVVTALPALFWVWFIGAELLFPH